MRGRQPAAERARRGAARLGGYGPRRAAATLTSAALVSLALLALSTVPARANEILLRTCDGCHSREGTARAASLPGLDGLAESYLREALLAYRDGRRDHYLMGMLARGLRAGEAADLASLFAARPFVAASDGVDALRAARGRTAAAACAECHGARFEGSEKGPRLAGQPVGYLHSALRAYRDGGRKGDEGMRDAVAGRDDATLGDLAHFVTLGEAP